MEIRLSLANKPLNSSLVIPSEDEELAATVSASEALDTPTTSTTETQWPEPEPSEPEASPVIAPSPLTDGSCYLLLFEEKWRNELFSRKKTWSLGSELLEEDVNHRAKDVRVGLWPVYSDEGRRRNDRVHVGEPDYAPVAGTPAELMRNWGWHCFWLGVNPAIVSVGGGSVNPPLKLPDLAPPSDAEKMDL